MKLSFSVWERRADGHKNKRYFKIQYTAALRLGVVLEARKGRLEVEFEGEAAQDVQAHDGKMALKGVLRIEGQDFPEVVLIARHRTDGKYDLVTFWPVSQHPDAHQSYTDPLVDTAMDDTPFDVRVVASRMHAAFVENAGVSPATLMKKIYEAESSVLKAAAEQIGVQLEQVQAELTQERSERQKAEADAANSRAELERLRLEAMRVARSSENVRASNVATLERVAEGPRGSNNQRAILLFMSDGTIRANNWPKGYEARLKYARRLIGQRVKTDVWGDYRWQEWFQNIYPVES